MLEEYFLERENLVTIKTEKFFFMYRVDVLPDKKILFIHTFYIPEKYRCGSAFKEMMAEIENILNKEKCSMIVCTVQTDDKNHPKILSLIFKAGFEIYLLKEKTIWLRSTENLKRGYNG